MGELLSSYDFLGAFWMTIKISVCAGLWALLLGTVVAVFRMSPVPVLRAFGALFVNIVRNTPLTLIVTFAQMVLLMELGWHVVAKNQLDTNNFIWGTLALGTYTAAFVCESIRSGVNTVPVGQAEAARSIGLGFRQTVTDIVLPQAFRAAIVPLGSSLVAMVKNSTVLSVISVAEVSFLQAKALEDRPDLMYQTLAIVAIGFVILTLPMGMATTHLGKRLAVKR